MIVEKVFMIEHELGDVLVSLSSASMYKFPQSGFLTRVSRRISGQMMEGQKHPNRFACCPSTWDHAKWQNQHYDKDFLWQKCMVRGLAFVRQLKGPDEDSDELFLELFTFSNIGRHMLKVKSMWN